MNSIKELRMLASERFNYGIDTFDLVFPTELRLEPASLDNEKLRTI